MRDYGASKAEHPVWGFKDPRICLFLPQWAHAFPDLSVICIYRPAVQAVHSLKRRAARDMLRGEAVEGNQRFWSVPDLAARMYIVYARALLSFLETFRGRSRVVSVDALLAGQDVVAEARDWGYPLCDMRIDDVADRSILTGNGQNEPIFDTSLLPEIAALEARFRAREVVGAVGPSLSQPEVFA